ncbi:MAG: hypothetical protein J6V82_00250, partial [Clostridia bacterium]|nr:hypothetical protein [Clostridia bacterium]
IELKPKNSRHTRFFRLVMFALFACLGVWLAKTDINKPKRKGRTDLEQNLSFASRRRIYIRREGANGESKQNKIKRKKNRRFFNLK